MFLNLNVKIKKPSKIKIFCNSIKNICLQKMEFSSKKASTEHSYTNFGTNITEYSSELCIDKEKDFETSFFQTKNLVFSTDFPLEDNIESHPPYAPKISFNKNSKNKLNEISSLCL